MVKDINSIRFLEHIYNKNINDITKEEYNNFKEKFIFMSNFYIDNNNVVNKDDYKNIIQCRLVEELTPTKICRKLSITNNKIISVWSNLLRKYELYDCEKVNFDLNAKIDDLSINDLLIRYCKDINLFSALKEHFGKKNIGYMNFKELKIAYTEQKLEFELHNKVTMKNLGVKTFSSFKNMMEDIEKAFPDEYNKYDTEISEIFEDELLALNKKLIEDHPELLERFENEQVLNFIKLIKGKDTESLFDDTLENLVNLGLFDSKEDAEWGTSSKIIEEIFIRGCCGRFAVILKTVFGKGDILLLKDECHVLYRLNNRLYDITGEVTKKYKDCKFKVVSKRYVKEESDMFDNYSFITREPII